MRSPSRLRRLAAGLAAGALVAGAFTVDTASATTTKTAVTADPFGGLFGGGSTTGGGFFGGGSSPGGGFDLGGLIGGLIGGGNTQNPVPTIPGINGDLGTVVPGIPGINDLLQPRPGTGTPVPSTGGGSGGLGDFLEKELKRLGVELAKSTTQRIVNSIINRARGGRAQTPEQQAKTAIQKQNCNPPAYVRLFGTPVAKGKFTSKVFIGGENVGKTLVVSDKAFLAPFGDKLKANSTAEYFFVAKPGVEGGSKTLTPQPKVAKNTVLEDRARYSPTFLTPKVTYTVVVRYQNTCNETVTDLLGQIRRK